MFDLQYAEAGVGTQYLIQLFARALPERLLSMDGEKEERFLNFYRRRLKGNLVRLSNKNAAQAYTRSVLQLQWELSLTSWVRFTQGWGAWGDWHWLEDRARKILLRLGWVQDIFAETSLYVAI